MSMTKYITVRSQPVQSQVSSAEKEAGSFIRKGKNLSRCKVSFAIIHLLSGE